MVLKIGEKIHIMARRAFETDIGRHFVGVVKKVGDNVARVEGHVFVFDTRSSQYVRKPETRTTIISLTDGRYIINVIPPSTKIDKVAYRTEGDNLVVTDGRHFKLEISEFGPHF
jgi:tRNA A58 N-methylase Trm61